MRDVSTYRTMCLDSESEEVVRGRGLNVIPPPEREPLWLGFLKKFKDPLIIVLLVVFFFSVVVSTYEALHTGGLSFTTYLEPLGVLVALLLATGVGFWFEVKASREFDVLNQVKNRRPVKVLRIVDGRVRTVSIPRHDVVVGDIVRLESGDEIPADGILLEAVNLRVDESNFTGELYASKACLASCACREPGAAYPVDMLLRSSTVIEGEAVMQVRSVGLDTEEGRGAVLAREDSHVKTPLNRQLDQLGRFISYAGFLIGALIVVGRLAHYFLTVGASGGFEWIGFFEMLLNSVMIAVALIVMAVPEGLPMSVTVSLAMSMRKMLKENNLVRRLHACETMGAATVICTDKTGTLTQNRMQVVEIQLAGSKEMDSLARAIAVNSTATTEVGNPTERALLRYIQQLGYDFEALRSAADVVSVVPFSTEIKRMETTLADGTSYMKGAPEIVCEFCSQGTGSQSDSQQPTANSQQLARRAIDWQQRGMRTLAFATRQGGGCWTLQAVVAIADPVRSDVAEAIDICRNHAHVRVIMVTGDGALTAREIASQAGLISPGETVVGITGDEFAALSDDEARRLVASPDFRILSRARPHDKARLVTLLQSLGEVVAVTGDGTNDAPALRQAQVGLSMGDGTARAKEASDITIIDNSFASINTAILWGRSLYLNIRRFIIYQMTINLAACLIVLYSACLGLPSPLTVTQMLWINLIMDTFAAMALSSLPADPRVMNDPPRRPDSLIINSAMTLRIVGVGLLFFGVYLLFTLLPHPFHSKGLFFTLFVLLQFWNLFNARYFRTDRSLLQDLAAILRHPRCFSAHYSSGFVIVLLAILLGQLLITNLFGDLFGTDPLTLRQWLLLLLLTSPVLILADIIRLLRNRVKEYKNR